MSKLFETIALSKGSAGKAWLENIPVLIAAYEKEWDMKVSAPFDLSYNYVAPVILNAGGSAVLKIGFPTDKEFKTEIEALKIYNGAGSVKLFKTNPEQTVILLERAEPGTPLVNIPDDEQATKVLASVMKKLWKPVPENHSFPIIAKRVNTIKEFRAENKENVLSDKLVGYAEDLFEELIATMAEPVLIHGDLHHRNVLSATREPWLAIDPKGVICERAYETSHVLRNPQPELLEKTDVKNILTRRIKIFSEELELDPERIRKWGIAQTVLSAIWTIKDQHPGWEYAIKVAEILQDIQL